MKKEEILSMVDDAIIQEEMALPIYAKHLKSVMFWSHFSQKEQMIIVEKLKLLIKETQAHAAYLNRVKDIVENKK